VDHSYIISHSSNNHVIPANENIYQAIKTIREKDRVVLKGLLVNLKGTYKGQTVTWNTSLSRTDIGNDSCELFYVSEVRIETKVYE
jgi:nitrogenase subunit NifH